MPSERNDAALNPTLESLSLRKSAICNLTTFRKANVILLGTDLWLADVVSTGNLRGEETLVDIPTSHDREI